MKTKWLDRTIVYGGYLCLVLSQKEYDKVMRKMGVPTETVYKSGGCTMLTNDEGKLTNIICLGNFLGQSLSSILALLAHECVHAADNTFESMKEKAPSKEFKAYVVQNIMQNVTDEFLSRVEVDGKLVVTGMKHCKKKPPKRK